MLLEGLHHAGKIHVRRRDAGIRVYASTPKLPRSVTPGARVDGLLRLVINLYAPRPLRSLMQCARVMGAARPGVDYIARAHLMFKPGWQRRETIDHITYVWPTDDLLANVIDDKVRLLASFDPVVWDRIRFEHFRGWRYRFEGYTPLAKRLRGYYALPLLWRDHVIGRGNVASGSDGRRQVQSGYARNKPARVEATIFKRAL